MNPEVEEFFHRIKFPFTIGYGMEPNVSPLISYAPWNEFVPTSSGRVLDIMEAVSARKTRTTNSAKYKYVART